MPLHASIILAVFLVSHHPRLLLLHTAWSSVIRKLFGRDWKFCAGFVDGE